MGRRWPVWAEIAAGAVTWVIAAMVILTWILPVTGAAAKPGQAPGTAARPRPVQSTAAQPAATETPPAQVPSGLAPLPRQPEEAWSVNLSEAAGTEVSLRSAGNDALSQVISSASGVWLVATREAGDGTGLQAARHFIAIDQESGSVLWQAKDVTYQGGTYSLLSCAANALAGSFVCWTILQNGEDPGQWGLMRLDPHTSRVTHALLYSSEDYFDSVEVTGGDLVLAALRQPASDSSATLAVQRQNAGGQVTWSHTEKVAAGPGWDGGSPFLTVAGHRMAFNEGGRVWFFDLRTGEQLDMPVGAGRLTPEGAAISQDSIDASELTGYAMLPASDGAQRIFVPVDRSDPSYSESDGAGIWIVNRPSGPAVAYDLVTGKERWRRDGIDGTLLGSGPGRLMMLRDGGELTGIDARNGAHVWRREYGSGLSLLPGLSDGERVVAGDGPHVMGLSLADGSVVWQVPVGGNRAAAPADDGPVAELAASGSLFTVAGSRLVSWRVP